MMVIQISWILDSDGDGCDVIEAGFTDEDGDGYLGNVPTEKTH